MEPMMEMDRLSYEIFSILENRFLFGGGGGGYADSLPETPVKTPVKANLSGGGGKVRILSVDGGSDGGILAGAALVSLEASLRSRSGDPGARIADFFDVAAGSGAGGVLAAMLFTRGPDGRPLFSAEEGLLFIAKNRRAISGGNKKGLLRGMFHHKQGGIFRRVFGESTLRDAAKPLLIACHDLATAAPFVFSRADAVETDGYDFSISDVCAATCALDRTVEMRSVDGKTAIAAVGGAVAMANPTAAAVTHVLHNKQEFPFANGVEDLLVVSLGSGEPTSDSTIGSSTPSRAELIKIAGIGAADTVDQAVAMAFGPHSSTNYIRVQANGFLATGNNGKPVNKSPAAAEVLSHRNVESVLFRGKKISEQSNGEKLDRFSEALIKEQQRRKTSPIPAVIIKQAMTPRWSSATIFTTFTATSSATSSTSP